METKTEDKNDRIVPVNVKLPSHPLDMSKMSTEELNKELQKGIDQIEMGKTLPIEKAFEKLDREFEKQ